MIYLDNAATSFFKPIQVKKAVMNAIEHLTANPGRSGHFLSQKTAEIVFDTREKIKQLFNAENYEVIFTKNCTEALNLAIFGSLNDGDHVITTSFEHNSVLRPLEHLKSKGVDVSTLFCEVENLPAEIEKTICKNTKMIITTACSNVTGETLPILEISKIAKDHNLLYLIDGAQASGHIHIDLSNLGVDMFAFAGHKGLFSTTGVGGLVVKRGTKLKPIIFGGTGTEGTNLIQPSGMPEGLEAGTIPSIPIISLNAGVEYVLKNFENILKKEQDLSSYTFKRLSGLNFIKMYSKPNSKNVFSFNVSDLDCMSVADLLNEKGICVRSGIHCAPLIHKKLCTDISGAVRVSIDSFNTFDEIDKLVNALIEMHSLKIKNTHNEN